MPSEAGMSRITQHAQAFTMALGAIVHAEGVGTTSSAGFAQVQCSAGRPRSELQQILVCQA